MRTHKLIRFGAVIGAAMLLAGCSVTASDTPIGGDIVAPVSMSVNELQGATVDLLVGQVLNIDTDALGVDSYTGEVADQKVAEFVPGADHDGATFNPGVTALAAGTTEVTMTNEQAGIQPLQFSVTVTKK